MRPEERQQQILYLLRAIQRVWSVEELTDSFHVSPITVRRDLDRLERDGVIVRTHGGCISVIHSGFESAYQEKIAFNFMLKQAIGKFAAQQIHDGECILILDSSTTFHLASYLGNHQDLTVYTNSIALITELARFSDVDIFVLGGKYNRDMLFLEGSLTHSVIELINFDNVFVSVDAIDVTGKCMVSNHETARMIQVLFRQTKKKTLLTDHTKVESKGNAICCRLSDFDLWITTAGILEKHLKKFKTMIKIKEVTL